jgi:hypothetical protein
MARKQKGRKGGWSIRLILLWSNRRSGIRSSRRLGMPQRRRAYQIGPIGRPTQSPKEGFARRFVTK